MDLHAEYAPKIESALARMAPGERVGWKLDTVSQQTENGTIRGLLLTLWSPAPILGKMLHWQGVILDVFTVLDNDAALLDEQVSHGVAAIRQLASEVLRG